MKQRTPDLFHYNKDISKKAFVEFNKILDIGCGPNKVAGSIGIDAIKSSGVDVVWDLDKFSWPFDDDSFDLVISHHAFEHLGDVVKTMEEVFRILKPGGRLIINVPYFRNIDAFSDITHKHFFTSHSMDYFIKGTKGSKYKYANIDVDLVGRWLGWPGPSRSKLRGIFKAFINKYPDFYEKYISYIYPVKNIVWEFVINKKHEDRLID